MRLSRPAQARRLDGPVFATAGFDGGEIQAIEGGLVLREQEFPEREEVFADVEAFEATVRAVEDFVTCVNALTAEIVGYLGEIIQLHRYSLRARRPALPQTG
ncbi:MAG TPA: hypothetical protein VMH28_28315 [Candidatus Acidoferrales bacterium]|nr:hypothetical protein [Candidatus Acidoferrales bacterium]